MSKRFGNRVQLDEYLNSIPMFKDVGMEASNYSLNAIMDFCESIGSPHNQFKSIHIAGTNGKGTTAYLIAETLNKAGFKAGLFTSPHLLDYRERVQINGKKIPTKDMLAFFNKHHEALEEFQLSYFEISTALAFWYFAKEKVDIGIIEAGLGGRLDATNIIRPELSIITSISKDHMDVLGNTLKEIATEKAGIIKEGGAVLVGKLPQQIHALIRDIANSRRAQFHNIQHLHVNYEDSIRIFDRGHWHDLGNSFPELVNMYNFALAWHALSLIRKTFPIQIDDKEVLMKDIKPYPGRFEKLNKNDWYFSGSHNVEGLWSVKSTLVEKFEPRDPVVICTSMKDKFTDEFADFISDYEKVYFYEMDSERAMKFEDFKKAIPNSSKINDSNAQQILSDLKDELVIFVGSFYFYHTVKGLVDNEIT